MDSLSQELENLTNIKAKWLEQYRGFAFTLCLAVLAVGIDDDMGDPISKQRHHMTIRCRMDDTIKIIATEATGSYDTFIKDFSITRRLIVTVEQLRPVYMTFTNDPQVKDKEFDVFVPGEWLEYANHILTIYDNHVNDQTHKGLIEKLAKLKDELLVYVDGFGIVYERHNKKEVDF